MGTSQVDRFPVAFEQRSVDHYNVSTLCSSGRRPGDLCGEVGAMGFSALLVISGVAILVFGLLRVYEKRRNARISRDLTTRPATWKRA